MNIKKRNLVPIYEKGFLTIDEASVYFNIGTSSLRAIVDYPDCNAALYVGSGGKRLINRRLFEEYIEGMYSV